MLAIAKIIKLIANKSYLIACPTLQPTKISLIGIDLLFSIVQEVLHEASPCECKSGAAKGVMTRYAEDQLKESAVHAFGMPAPRLVMFSEAPLTGHGQ